MFLLPVMFNVYICCNSSVMIFILLYGITFIKVLKYHLNKLNIGERVTKGMVDITIYVRSEKFCHFFIIFHLFQITSSFWLGFESFHWTFLQIGACHLFCGLCPPIDQLEITERHLGTDPEPTRGLYAGIASAFWLDQSWQDYTTS